MELEKAYNHQLAEEKIYALWEKSGFFAPQQGKGKQKVFSMVLPPPNVTGTLHMGHAAMLAMEDILARYRRMKGEKTLWLPGTDHAAIATESKVEQLIYKKEGKTRQDLGREEFLKRVNQFAKESHDTIVHQIKKMGASLDWTREAYTLDKPRSKAVREAFKRMYGMGLIYRGFRIVNWDPKMQTTVSDDEIEWREEKTPFYYIKYGPFTIATARPETKFGDKYVVMHPDDKRYSQYKDGQQIPVEWINGKITATIVKDKAVDMEFGTGVMTITPWHDAIDFEIAQRHNLEKEQIIDLKGKLLPIAKEFAGLYITKARTLIVQKLQEKGLIEKVDEAYAHRIATNSRGNGTIEPQIMRQWFVAVNKKFEFPHADLKGIKKGQKVTLKELMAHAVKTKQIEIIPERFTKIYFHWIDNLRDWCISRQVWFGHRIPVWYHEPVCIPIPGREKEIEKCEEIVVGEATEKCPHCNAHFIQDEDTLDTWFSSGLWTFSTLGWPEETEDLKTFHPTSVLETGYDILFFWVARMILMSTCLLGEIPFKTVYLHGLVRDAKGQKMSKSLGNIIDPLTMIEKYGADATRLSLIIGAAPGNDLKLSEDRVRGYRNFSNKLWNIARFLLMNLQDYDPTKKTSLSNQEKKYVKEFERIAKETTRAIENFRLSEAAETLYQYAWHTFADKILEESKTIFANNKTRAARQQVLLTIFADCLKLLHPFCPFITEELYQNLPIKNKKETLMAELWLK